MEVKLKEKDSEIVKEVPKKEKARDISIDLIRVVACMTVILIHLSLQLLNPAYNRIDWSRLLEKCFFTDGVPLFFMITGFFLVNGRSYKKIWKSTLKKILFPSFIFVIFVQLFNPFILNKMSLADNIKNLNFSVTPIIQSILKADVSYLNALCKHLWYIFSYIKIVIWIPILWCVCKEENNSKLARRIMLGVAIASAVLVDIQKFYILPFIREINLLTIIPREIMYVLLGYELFIHRDKIKNNKKLCIISLIGFVLINIIRYRIEILYMVINSLTDVVDRPNFIEWKYTCLNIFSAICLFIFLYSFDIKNEKLSKVILWLSNKTFGIYLVHYLILAKIDLYKFEKIEKFVFELLYLFIGMIVTLILSLIILAIIQNIKKLFVKGVKLLIKKKEI